MVKDITGIEKLLGQMHNLRTDYFTGQDAKDYPKNRIFLVDYAWDLDNAIMPNHNFSFASSECKKIAEYRSKPQKTSAGDEQNPYHICEKESDTSIPILHGTACTGVLCLNRNVKIALDVKRDTGINDGERNLWNICPDTDIVLVPVREFPEISAERFRRTVEIITSQSNTLKYAFDTLSAYFDGKDETIHDWWKNVTKDLSSIIDHEKYRKEVEQKISELAKGRMDPDMLNSMASMLIQLSLPLFNEFGIVKALEKVQKYPALTRGDVVVMPIEFKPVSSSDILPFFPKGHDPKMRLPIIIYPEVEKAIKLLTYNDNSDKCVSVVISAGNAQYSLSNFDVEAKFANAMCGTIAKGRKNLFKKYGSTCGAVIVGATDLERKINWLNPLRSNKPTPEEAKKIEDDQKTRRDNSSANHGICVDVFGRGTAKQITHATSTLIQDDLYAHWCGTSIAAVVAAACLATVQHYRMMIGAINVKNNPYRGLQAMKPYEARSHLRTYRVLDSYKYHFHTELTGSPPDVLSMLNSMNIDETLIKK